MVLVWDGRWLRSVGSMAMAVAWVSVRLLLSVLSPFSFPYSSHWDFFGFLPKHAQFDSVSALGFTCTFRSSLSWFLHIHLVSAPIYLPIFPYITLFQVDVLKKVSYHQPTYCLILFSQVHIHIWKSWLFMDLLYHCSFLYAHEPL